MGAWGGLCSFDHTRLLQQVVPAFAAGEQHPLIQLALARLREAYPRRHIPAFTGLAQLAPFYDPGMTGCSLGTHFIVCNGVIAHDPQPASQCRDRWGYEELAELFEWTLTQAAIGQYTVLGLAFTALRQLFPPELLLDGITTGLLGDLDNRCRYWAAGTGGYGEGIQGWLDSEEAVLLASTLTPLAPANNQVENKLLEHWGGNQATAAHHMERITNFLAALQLAVAQGQGVLWGRDLQLFYSSAQAQS